MPAYRYPLRVTAGLGVVCVLATVGAIQSYSRTAAYEDSQRDVYSVAAAELRFAALKPKLPRSEMVGYITDLPPGSVANTTAFLAAQYALAPALLVSIDPRVKFEYAIGNFSRPQDFAAAGASKGLQLVEDLGQGVILYRIKKDGR